MTTDLLRIPGRSIIDRILPSRPSQRGVDRSTEDGKKSGLLTPCLELVLRSSSYSAPRSFRRL